MPGFENQLPARVVEYHAVASPSVSCLTIEARTKRALGESREALQELLRRDEGLAHKQRRLGTQIHGEPHRNPRRRTRQLQLPLGDWDLVDEIESE
jgi:hypothetical protein